MTFSLTRVHTGNAPCSSTWAASHAADAGLPGAIAGPVPYLPPGRAPPMARTRLGRLAVPPKANRSQTLFSIDSRTMASVIFPGAIATSIIPAAASNTEAALAPNEVLPGRRIEVASGRRGGRGA